MKKIILLGSKDPGGKNDIKNLHSHLQAELKNAEISVVCLENLVVKINSDEQYIVDSTSNFDLSQADLVLSFNWYKTGTNNLCRDLAFTIALYLEKNKVQFWNSEMLKQRSVSKLSATMQLALMGLAVPDTYFSLDSEKLLKETKHTPFILKSAIASRGKDNYLCQTLDEAKQHLNLKLPNYFIIQEYIENDSDLRVICFGGDPALLIERRRTSDQTHLNNVSQGAEPILKKLTDLPQNIIDECKRICYNMGREMAGIDIMPRKNKPGTYVYLEVNAIPQLSSGAYVAEKLSVLAKSLNEQKE